VTVLRSIDEVVAVVRERADGHHRIIVGIAGAPGAGKSTIAAQLVAAIGPSAILLPMDGFHLPQSELLARGRRDRMGAPDTFDVPALLQLLDRVENSGLRVLAPEFDREIEEPVAGAIDVNPEFSTVVVEGNYLLLDSGGWEHVAGYLGLSFFVEVDDDVRVERLIARHRRFGKSEVAARAWALGPDEANARVIATTAPRADYTIALG
jgi:pantothenate kinase